MPGWFSGFFSGKNAKKEKVCFGKNPYLEEFSEKPEKSEKKWEKQKREELEQPLGTPADYPAKKFLEGKKYHIPLESYLSRFCKQDEEVKDEYLYEIRLLRGKGCLKNPEFSGDSIYCDGEYSFALVRRLKADFTLSRWFESAIALISFRIPKFKKSVKIVQIQGVRGKRRFLEPLRWEHLLVNVVIDWAKANGFKTAEIQRGEDNKWYRDSPNKDGFKLRYDVTAERCGFRYSEKRRVYVLYLKKPAV